MGGVLRLNQRGLPFVFRKKKKRGVRKSRAEQDWGRGLGFVHSTHPPAPGSSRGEYDDEHEGGAGRVRF